jgi:hypothetical protein
MTRAALRSLMLLLIGSVTALTPALAFAQTFQPQTRLGASLPGDTWEPAIAAELPGDKVIRKLWWAHPAVMMVIHIKNGAGSIRTQAPSSTAAECQVP